MSEGPLPHDVLATICMYTFGAGSEKDGFKKEQNNSNFCDCCSNWANSPVWMVWVLGVRARTKPVGSLCAAVWETNGSACRRRQLACLLYLDSIGQSEVTPGSHVAPPHWSKNTNLWYFGVDCKDYKINGEQTTDLSTSGCRMFLICDLWEISIFCFLFLQFIYVNQSFAPSPDQEVGTLYEVTLILDILSKCV